MEINVTELEGLSRKLTVILPQEYVSREMDAAYRKLQSEVVLKGFRKGKAPREILKRTFKPQVEKDLVEKLIQDTYFDALQQSKLDAVVHPEVKKHSFSDDGSFTYEAEIDIRPVFELADYKGLQIDVSDISVTDEDVDEGIEKLRRRIAPLRSVEERGVQLHDTVYLDFTAYHDGEQIKQISGKNVSVEVGSENHGKEFESALIGLKKGENNTREVEFPDSLNNPLLAGKKIEFHISVHDVKERVLPRVDDEFAKDINSEFKTTDDLREHIRTMIRQQKEALREGEISDKIMQKLLDAHDFAVPNRSVVYETEMQVKEMEKNLLQQGQTFESTGLNRLEVAERFRELSIKRVKGDFIIKKIAEQEKITLSDDDMNKGFERVAKQYNMPIEEVKKYFRAREYLLPFMSELLNEKVLAMLREKSEIKSAPPENQGEKGEES